ncbi:S8 family serine peptidase [Nocardioides sp. MAHUQ-72]|uniref:S8 family serine peptidase n=1 Tax=unclassified Nocardioides TaxID=2615069 RepID=UPI00360E6233
MGGRAHLRHPSSGRRALAGVASALALVAAATGLVGLPVQASAAADTALYLVTLDGPGTAGDRSLVPASLHRLQLRQEQDDVLAQVGSPTPVYRWTTALNGVAVRLTRAEADRLAADSHVALVEKNAVRRLAGAAAASGDLTGPGHRRGGAGTVIGVVDSGIWPDNPLFSDVPRLGRAPRGFRGSCQVGEGWGSDTCNRKLVGARWFVDGFGSDRVRTSSSLSARDDDGHGSEMASIAAGNAGVSVLVHGQRLGGYGGMAPQSRLAVYKACWTAPDPADDGCATADLVTAIDQATRDGVDVLNLSVGGPPAFDTVERALLGAAEGDVVVVAAAGNRGSRGFAAHPGPWVTTVGGTTDVVRRGRVVLDGGPSLTGAMASTRGVGRARLVVGGQVAAPGASRAAARVCTPGSLDAGRVRGAVVLCERGGIGRVDKSRAVDEADGVGMVLANPGPGTVDSDFHSVPTVHLDRADSVALRTWHAAHPRARVALRPVGVEHPPTRLARFTAGGDPTAAVLKPDVVAPGVGLLGAVPPTVRDTRWDFVSGTSAATAYTSGTAALLRSRNGWSASVVRSVLATTAAPLAGAPSALRAGAGRVRSSPVRPGVVYAVPPHRYRAWLDGALAPGRLNTPSLLLSGDESAAARTITNVGRRALYFSSSATGFTRHSVVVHPAAVRLAPGESARFTVRVTHLGGIHPLDDGWVTWRGGNGTSARIPVLIGR